MYSGRMSSIQWETLNLNATRQNDRIEKINLRSWVRRLNLLY